MVDQLAITIIWVSDHKKIVGNEATLDETEAFMSVSNDLEKTPLTI